VKAGAWATYFPVAPLDIDGLSQQTGNMGGSMMPGEVPVSDLIRRCRQGEAAARDELFARYRHYLWLLAQGKIGGRLRTRCDPSDLVQQTLLEAFRDFAGFTGAHEAELLAWLRQILAHNLYNEARHQGAQRRDAARQVSLEEVQAGLEQSSVTLGNCLAGNVPSPSHVAGQHEAAVHLADTLARLPEDYQTVLRLRVFEELPAEEVAKRMGRTAGAVRMLQLRALTALREMMEKPRT
jgi:RNA polymerase sigma-70 factor (ECF subfamily)